MSWLARTIRKLVFFAGSDRRNRELEEEMAFHRGLSEQEMMAEGLSADDARSTAELGDRFAIEPAFVEYPRVPFRLNGGPFAVPEDFSYASDTNTDWLSADALMAMVEEKQAA